MTMPNDIVTSAESNHTVIVYFPLLDNDAISYSSSALIESLDDMVFYTISGEADDTLFEEGFAFAISIEAFALFMEVGTPEEIIKHILMLYQLLGMSIHSYKESLTGNKLFWDNLEIITALYSERFFAASTMLSIKTKAIEPLATSCSCRSAFPLLIGAWHEKSCAMYSTRSFPIRYDPDPPCCTLLLSGQYDLDSITVTLREGLLVLTSTMATEKPVFGNIISDLNSLAKTVFIDYLEALNYQLDYESLPQRWIK